MFHGDFFNFSFSLDYPFNKIDFLSSSLPPAKPTKAKAETVEQEAGNANTNTTNSGMFRPASLIPVLINLCRIFPYPRKIPVCVGGSNVKSIIPYRCPSW
jgi:hypothetical protein